MIYHIRPFFVTVVFFILTSSAINAQTMTNLYLAGTGDAVIQVSPMYVQNFPEPITMSDFGPGKGKRSIGVIMVMIGASIQAVGIATIIEELEEEKGSSPPSKSDPDGFPEEGLMIFSAGFGIAFPGALLWAKGAKKFNEYKKAQQQSLRLKINSGVSLAYRF
jgi:hypothetical protein